MNATCPLCNGTGKLAGVDPGAGLFEADCYCTLLERMQTPEAKEGVKKAFEATPKELGEAAVHGIPPDVWKK